MSGGVIVDWCVTYKFNKIMALDSIRTIDLFQRETALLIWGDFASQDDEIYKLLTYYNRVVITLYIMFFLILNYFGVIVIYFLDNLNIIIQ